MGSVAIAYSGGVDSALVLAAAHSVLGKNAVAVTADSASLARRELNTAGRLAEKLGADHRVLSTHEMASPDYTANPVNRCYHCKSELYSQLRRLADERGLKHLVNGTNLDDLGDHRPGLAAAREYGVLSPLCDAGMSKQDVRDLARQWGLPVWDKPAMPCLSSRIPYGDAITIEKLAMIERAEDYLVSLGFRQLRVRHLGESARIELLQDDLPRFYREKLFDGVRRHFREIGFTDVVVDPRGFQSGRLNEAIPSASGSQ